MQFKVLAQTNFKCNLKITLKIFNVYVLKYGHAQLKIWVNLKVGCNLGFAKTWKMCYSLVWFEKRVQFKMCFYRCIKQNYKGWVFPRCDLYFVAFANARCKFIYLSSSGGWRDLEPTIAIIRLDKYSMNAIVIIDQHWRSWKNCGWRRAFSFLRKARKGKTRHLCTLLRIPCKFDI